LRFSGASVKGAFTLWPNQRKRRVLRRSPPPVKRDRRLRPSSQGLRCLLKGRLRKRLYGPRRRPSNVRRRFRSPERQSLARRPLYLAEIIASGGSTRSPASRRRSCFNSATPWSIPWPVLPRTLFARALKAARLQVLECTRATPDRTPMIGASG